MLFTACRYVGRPLSHEIRLNLLPDFDEDQINRVTWLKLEFQDCLSSH